MRHRAGFQSETLYYRLCALVLFFAAAAASFNGYFDVNQLFDTTFGSFHGKGSFEAEIDGTDTTPFVYRRLLPATANWINSHVSQRTEDKLYNLKGRTGLYFRNRIIKSPLARDRTYFLRYWVMYAAVFLFAWISVFAMYLAGKAAGLPPPAAALAALAMIIIFPYIQSGVGHYYDYPGLAFVMLAAWMAMKFDWWWMVPLAVLATFNYEAFLAFIPALYPLIRHRTSRRQALIGTGSLGLICTIVYESVRFRFRNNPGGAADWRVHEQIHFFLKVAWNPRAWVLAKTYGIWGPPTLNFLSVALVVWTVWRARKILPRYLQTHILIAAIINVPLYFLFCMPGELRDLSLLYVPLLIVLGANLTMWMGASIALPEQEGRAMEIPANQSAELSPSEG